MTNVDQPTDRTIAAELEAARDTSKRPPAFPSADGCPFGSMCPQVVELKTMIQGLGTQMTSEHEMTRKAIANVERRLDWCENAGEVTMAETVKAKAKATEALTLAGTRATGAKWGGAVSLVVAVVAALVERLAK